MGLRLLSDRALRGPAPPGVTAFFTLRCLARVDGTAHTGLMDTTSALCAQTDPELFFPGPGESSRTAKELCAKCPLMQPCREWALINMPEYGTWGGMSRKQRLSGKGREMGRKLREGR